MGTFIEGAGIRRLGVGMAVIAAGLGWATSAAGVPGVGTGRDAPAAGAASGTSAAPELATAKLRDSGGRVVGSVRFTSSGEATVVLVRLALDPAAVTTNAVHGLHVHANNDAANGTGCLADPGAAATTWFVSADGHWKLADQDHGAHLGDLVSVFVTTDGTGTGRSVTDRFEVGELAGRAVVLHAGPDNFGNVPTGPAANQYTANAVDATTLTAGTGNAGPRIACGVITVR